MKKETNGLVNLAMGIAFLQLVVMFAFKLFSSLVLVVESAMHGGTLNVQYFVENFLWFGMFLLAIIVLAVLLYIRRAFASTVGHPVALVAAGIGAIAYAGISLCELVPQFYAYVVYYKENGSTDGAAVYTQVLMANIIVFAVQILLGVLFIILGADKARKLKAAPTDVEENAEDEIETEASDTDPELEAFADANTPVFPEIQNESEGETVSGEDAPAEDAPAAEPVPEEEKPASEEEK